ncbi:MAG: sugar phosphate nucleotidyltransferase [Akkermansia sp.]
MQSFILCAGLGTRLAPLTHILPKPLMPMFLKPLVHHIMDRHYAAGVRAFALNTSQHALAWDKAFPSQSYRGCPVHLSHEAQPLDSGGGLKKIMPFIKKDAPLIVQNGDIYTDIPIDELLLAHQKSGKMLTLALRTVDGKKNVGFDPASGLVTDLRPALGVDAGSSQFAGVYIMEPSIAELFPTPEDEETEFSIIPIWLELIKRGEVAGAVFDWANWYEIGSPQQYLDAVMEIPSAQRTHDTAIIASDALISEDCVIGELSHIKSGVELIDCIVWPRTHVEAGRYERCILTPCIKVPCL